MLNIIIRIGISEEKNIRYYVCIRYKKFQHLNTVEKKKKKSMGKRRRKRKRKKKNEAIFQGPIQECHFGISIGLLWLDGEHARTPFFFLKSWKTTSETEFAQKREKTHFMLFFGFCELSSALRGSLALLSACGIYDLKSDEERRTMKNFHG